MKYAFASRTGNVEEIISSLGIDALRINDGSESIDEPYILFGSLTLTHSQNSQMSFMYGFFFVKFLIFAVVCVVIMI